MRKVGDLRTGQVRGRRPALHRMPFLEKRTKSASIAVVQYDLGPYQIGAFLILGQRTAGSARKRPMAGYAFSYVNHLAARGCFRIDDLLIVWSHAESAGTAGRGGRTCRLGRKILG